MKTLEVDKKIHSFVEKKGFAIVLFFVVSIALLIRAYFIPITEYSADYTICWYPWWLEYKEYGVIGGLGRTIGDYYVPYNLIVAFSSLFPMQPCYIMALFSILCDCLCSLYVYRFLTIPALEKYISKKRAALIAVCILYLPCMLLNGALWKQCDSVYTAFCVMFLYYMATEKYNKSIIAWTIGFAFKLQAIFLLPLVFLMYFIKKKFSFLTYLWIPFIFLLSGLPAILCGRSVWDTYGTYLFQTGEGAAMMTNTTNIYEFGFIDPKVCAMPAILITAVVLVLYCYKFYTISERVDDKDIMMMATWISWTCYMFLPRMRQRYDFLAVVLLSVYLLAFEYSNVWIAIIVNVVSLAQYSRYLFKMEMSVVWLSIPYVLMYMLFSMNVFRKMDNKAKMIEKM
ncbi:hypothetical protein [Butyrivibrio sp. XBB1001]|uniref:hypothetical protein n=1 Tax=Butyrivibrio sp. XBB1001 TaxID=1280682 RepID=UPI00042816AA|nr:hypothetical protein [Butyrivibrio sp. XBB1001]